jgi:hypothetical protein
LQKGNWTRLQLEDGRVALLFAFTLVIEWMDGSWEGVEVDNAGMKYGKEKCRDLSFWKRNDGWAVRI